MNKGNELVASRSTVRVLRAIGFAGVLGVGVLGTLPLFGSSGGISVSSYWSTGCVTSGCHSGGSTPTVTIEGLNSLAGCDLSAPYYCIAASSTDNAYVHVVSPQTHAGFNMFADGGSLAPWSDSYVRTVASGGGYAAELTHSAKKPRSGSDVYFYFTYTAPSTGGIWTLDAWGNSVNNNATTTGDYAASSSSAYMVSCPDNDSDGYYSYSWCPNATDCNDSNSTVSPGDSETCSNTGTDNDCDGSATELTNGVFAGDACTTGNFGVCSAGTRACSGGSLVCNQTNSIGTETCSNTGTDNDCDGNSSEIANNVFTGTACTTGNSGICSAGTYYCNGTSLSCAQTNSAGTETCSNTGTDNDCDGNAAELNNGVFAGDACSTGLSGICSAGTRACSGGSLVCNQTTTAGTETCSNTGTDNDCDGNAAELTDGVVAGDACTTGLQGVCSAGTRACSAGSLSCTQTTASSAEICDNLDNDCDGTVDEGCDDDGDNYCDSGVAKAGGVTVTTCTNTSSGATVGNDCNDACANCNPAGTEVCDGLDNDCDTTPDDNIAATTCGLGVCQQTATACIGGVPQNCTPGTPGTETCSNTGTDNDCDGNTAELNNNVFAGDACTTGLQGVCSAGTRACSGSSLVCTQTTSSSAESCSNAGADNDCDGDTTEIAPGIHVGDACAVGGGVGVCAAGTYACSGSTLVCNQTIAPGTVAETCGNAGVDNDCDGDATELTNGVHANDVCVTGQPGECSAGKQQCVSGNLSCVADNVSTAESCDNKDNDCDGATDEGIAFSTCGVGECARTGTTCFAASCTPGSPTTETCDNKNNDCDGSTDEGCDDDNDNYCDATMTLVGSSSTCPNGGGDCDDATSVSNPAANEICDGDDNDCNGQEDDDIAALTCGVGICQRTASGCTNGSPENCTPGAAETETCNALDDDCDGTPDDGIPLATCGVGQCARTGTTCNPASCTPGSAVAEICDDLDNDCDGSSDEEVPLSTCGQGICQRTGVTCHPESCVPGTPLEEICDGIDNNCNGVPDDSLPLSSCGQGICKTSGSSCLPSTCVPLPAEELETCNGLDDDCDGVVDNGCDNDGDGYCNASLDMTSSPLCPNGGGDCNDENADTFPGGLEICDGADNDCNGTNDDEISDVFCGKGACKAPGTACVNGEATDCTPLEPTDEVCDNVDNDCDGFIDDDLNEVECGVGECRVVIVGCRSGVAAECVPLDPTDEICDGRDNDCDGQIDDGELCEVGAICLSGACFMPGPQNQGGASGIPSGAPPDDVLVNTAGAASLAGGPGQGGSSEGDGSGQVGGCGCKTTGSRSVRTDGLAWASALVVGWFAWRRRRRHAA